LKAAVRTKTSAGQLFEGAVDYVIYPPNLREPFLSRRFRNGERLYASLCIARDDYEARLNQVAANFELFGAPVGLFVCIDRDMLQGQWADLGIFLQTLMLAAKAKGLDTAPLEAWSLWPRAVGEALDLPAETMLFCAVALGYADPDAPANRHRAERAELSEFAKFRGFEAVAAK
jgi:nitroreductase